MASEGQFEAFLNAKVYKSTPEDRALTREITAAVQALTPSSRVVWAGSLAKHTAVQGSDLDFWVEGPEEWNPALRLRLKGHLAGKAVGNVTIHSHVVRIQRTPHPKADISFAKATFGERPSPDTREFHSQPARQQAARALKIWTRTGPLPHVPGWAIEGLVIGLDQRQRTGLALFLRILRWLREEASPQKVETILRPRAKPWRPEWSALLDGPLQALRNHARRLLARDLGSAPLRSAKEVGDWLSGVSTPSEKSGSEEREIGHTLRSASQKKKKAGEEETMSNQNPRPNDQRSNVKNPNNAERQLHLPAGDVYIASSCEA